MANNWQLKLSKLSNCTWTEDWMDCSLSISINVYTCTILVLVMQSFFCSAMHALAVPPNVRGPSLLNKWTNQQIRSHMTGVRNQVLRSNWTCNSLTKPALIQWFYSLLNGPDPSVITAKSPRIQLTLMFMVAATHPEWRCGSVFNHQAWPHWLHLNVHPGYPMLTHQHKILTVHWMIINMNSSWSVKYPTSPCTLVTTIKKQAHADVINWWHHHGNSNQPWEHRTRWNRWMWTLMEQHGSQQNKTKQTQTATEEERNLKGQVRLSSIL